MKQLSDSIVKEILRLYTTSNPDGTWNGSTLIARQLGISQTSVPNILRSHGIKMRSNKESHSGGKRCKPVNQPPGPPPSCACGCGLPTKWVSQTQAWQKYAPGHYRKPRLYHDREWLTSQYREKGRTIPDIARECGVCVTSIIKRLRKLGIPMRSQGESLALSGACRSSRNPAWKGGVAQWEYAPNWKRIAHTIRKRDAYTCQLCHTIFPKSSKLLHVHHIDGDKFNNEPSNLACVCATCHPKGKRKEHSFVWRTLLAAQRRNAGQKRVTPYGRI